MSLVTSTEFTGCTRSHLGSVLFLPIAILHGQFNDITQILHFLYRLSHICIAVRSNFDAFLLQETLQVLTVIIRWKRGFPDREDHPCLAPLHPQGFMLHRHSRDVVESPGHWLYLRNLSPTRTCNYSTRIISLPQQYTLWIYSYCKEFTSTDFCRGSLSSYLSSS